MSLCPSCKAENPQGSKFCAGCGAALPKMPVNVRCGACGAESPEGSRFCKSCGKPVGAATGPQGPIVPGGGAGQVATRPKAPSESLQRIKMLLGAGAGLYAFGIFLMYTELARVRAAYGPYAGQVPGSGLQWFLIVLDAALAAGNLYAISLVGKGDFKYARYLFGAMAGLGLIFFLRGLSGPVVYILINAALVAAGVYGWRLISREQRALAA
jgi:hypothetical protein